MGEVITTDDYVQRVKKHLYVAVDTTTNWKKAIPSMLRRLPNVDPSDFPMELHYIDCNTMQEAQP